MCQLIQFSLQRKCLNVRFHTEKYLEILHHYCEVAAPLASVSPSQRTGFSYALFKVNSSAEIFLI
ncbi:hypothetical protein ABF87_04315 [Nitrosomonas sp. JL21]|nr:hypothetical protein [Nitrosomonas sp. JL21]